MSVDLLFTAHNRLEFTQASFAALLANTSWARVARLHVLDDLSTDGTANYLMSEVSEFYSRTGMKIDCISDRFGGPVAAMNRALDDCESSILAKIDNDVIVCPGWLDVMLETLEAHPRVDALGMEPGFGGDPESIDVMRGVEPARWIGGIGLIRTRVFAHRRPSQSRRFWGWSEHQRHFSHSAWITPALPTFLLDHLPFEPWVSLTERYIEQGWQRRLRRTKYEPELEPFWRWWTEAQVPA